MIPNFGTYKQLLLQKYSDIFKIASFAMCGECQKGVHSC